MADIEMYVFRGLACFVDCKTAAGNINCEYLALKY